MSLCVILPESFCCQCDIEAMYSNKCNGLPNENDMAQKLNCKSLYSFVNSSKSSKAFNLQFVDISYLNKGCISTIVLILFSRVQFTVIIQISYDIYTIHWLLLSSLIHYSFMIIITETWYQKIAVLANMTTNAKGKPH